MQRGKPSAPTSQPGSPRPATHSGKGVSGWIRKHIHVGREAREAREATQGDAADLEVTDVFESSEYSLTDYEMESTGDLA